MNPISLSNMFQVHGIAAETIYNLLLDGVEKERQNLVTHKSDNNIQGYRLSTSNINQYERMLSILRCDTLDGNLSIRSNLIN